MIYIAIGPHAWGAASSEQLAISKCKTNMYGERLPEDTELDFFVTEDPRPYVSSMGDLSAERPISRVSCKGQYLKLHTEM